MSDSSYKGVAIITGAAEGIGRGIALRLVSDGFDVAINDIPAKIDALERVVNEIKASSSRRAISVPGDVSNESDVKGIVERVVQEFGGLDVMIANAGVAVNKPLADTATVDEWDRLFAVNVRGTFLCYKYAADVMLKQGRGGRIIGACSIAGKKGIPEAACYSSTKFAIRGLTQSAAQEYGKYGITVNAYAPGAIETGFLGQFDGYHASKGGLKPGEWTEALKGGVALGKNGSPTEVASLVSYLVSKDAHFITDILAHFRDVKMSPQMSDSSSKGVAIITGAAEGIGRGIALRLVSDGFDVAINDIAPKQAALDQLVSEITSKTSRRAIAVPGDVSKDGDVKGIVDKVVRELGGLDVVCPVVAFNLVPNHQPKTSGQMIANAGIAVNKPIAESIAEAACYSSTKFAVRGLTQSAAQEYGKFGITVNAYAPGHIETQFLGRFDGYQANKKGLKPGEWTETLKSTVAVGKNGTPTEIASLVSYLVSKDAHFITGQSIIVDGGGLFD
ncbi:hypothetical protein EYR36_011850 [Pleurotus pulmonarius]|nr:hypothetical protein EYR36_011850 [Pleurotus pulmonarius]